MYESDVDLVGFVRDRPRRQRIKTALARYKIERAHRDSIEQLRRRYERVATAYPGEWYVVRRGPFFARIFDHKPLAGMAALTGRTWPVRKPSKY